MKPAVSFNYVYYYLQLKSAAYILFTYLFRLGVSDPVMLRDFSYLYSLELLLTFLKDHMGC